MFKRLIQKYKDWKFNKELNRYFSKIDSELSKNSRKAPGRSLGGLYHYPTILGYEQGFTRIPARGSNAFRLNPPISGVLRDLTYQEDPKDKVLLRSAVGYAAMARMKDNPKNIPGILDILVKNMINSMKNELGYGPDKIHYGKWGTFRRPGKKPRYFTLLENVAGYELRLYSDCYNIERYDQLRESGEN